MKIEKFNISNVENDDIEITDVDEIARRTFQLMIKNSLVLATGLLKGQEEEIDFKERFKKLTQEIFEMNLKALEKYAEEK